MNVEDKISNFLREQKVISESALSPVKVTNGTNKNGERLFFVRASKLEQPIGSIAYSNTAIYIGFNSDGDCVGSVNVSVCNVNPPSRVEMEYWANDQFRNQGNITLLAQEVIKEIFDEKCFDGLMVRKTFPKSNISSTVVSINPDNYASLAVARKLGFDEQGRLDINDYLSAKSSVSLK